MMRISTSVYFDKTNVTVDEGTLWMWWDMGCVPARKMYSEGKKKRSNKTYILKNLILFKALLYPIKLRLKIEIQIFGI